MRAFAVVLLLALAGCLQSTAPPAATTDGVDATPTALLLELPDAISGMEPLANVEIGGANDLVFHGDLVFVSTANNGMHIVDVRDPASPMEIAMVDCNGSDIGVIDLGARLIVTISAQGDDQCPNAAPDGGIRLVDATIPSAPVVLGQVPLKYGSHTHTPYGDTGLIYNSAYNLAGNPLASPLDHHRSEIVNVSDPENPVVDGEFLFPQTSGSIGCHDILAEPDLNRAVCAGISETMIWDLADPHAPKVIATITNPGINIHHSADSTRNGTLLAIGDEYAGAIAPACFPQGTPGPTGAIWFYDITDPADPQMLGYVPPPEGPSGSRCTAHNFAWVDDDRIVSGFYSGGSMLIDATDPASPTVLTHIAQAPTSSWATYYHRGVVFSGDGVRGLDVYRLV